MPRAAIMKPNAQPIGSYDTQIAGHALSLGAILVTHDTGEFKRVPGLQNQRGAAQHA